MMGFAVIVGSQTFNAPATYIAPKGFRTITATVTPGEPGGGSLYGDYSPYPYGTPGTPGGPSSFKGAASAVYQRSASGIVPRQVIAVVVGSGGAGGSGGCFPGSPGAPGSVVVSVA